MDKEKEIEEMAHRSGFCEHPDRHCLERYGDCSECSTYARCESLINAGYGNVKQAVKEFAERLVIKIDFLIGDAKDKGNFYSEQGDYELSIQADKAVDTLLEVKTEISELLKELHGEVNE